MATKLITDTYLTNIANAIRQKNGSSDTYTPSEMATSIINLPIGGDYEDIQYITTGYSLFSGNTNIINISLGDFTNINTSASYMFSNCSNLETVTIGDISNATSSANMFRACSNLTEIIIGNLDSVTNSAAMFYGCSNLTDLTMGNISNSTNTSNMFIQCSKLTNLSVGNLPECDLSFLTCSLLTHTSLMNIINHLPTVETTKTLTLHSSALTRLSVEEIAIATEKNWNIT